MTFYDILRTGRGRIVGCALRSNKCHGLQFEATELVQTKDVHEQTDNECHGLHFEATETVQTKDVHEQADNVCTSY